MTSALRRFSGPSAGLGLMPFGYSDTLVPLVGDGDGDGLGVDIQADIFDDVRCG